MAKVLFQFLRSFIIYFEEVRTRLKKLSAYGDDLAGSRENWDYDARRNLWRRHDVQGSSAHLKNVILFGEGTTIDPTARIRDAIIGPHVRILEEVQIEGTNVCGYDWDNMLPRSQATLNWPPRESVIRNSSLIDAKEIKASILNYAISENAGGIVASVVDMGEVSGPNSKLSWSLLRGGSRIMNGGQATNSILDNYSLLADPQSVANHCTLKGENEIRNGARAVDSVFEKGTGINQPGVSVQNEFVDSNHYLVPSPEAEARLLPFPGEPGPVYIPRRGAIAVAGSPFTRSRAENEALLGLLSERAVLAIAA